MGVAKETLLRAVRGDLCLCGQGDCPMPEGVVTAYRAEVLREAADAAEGFTERWPDIEAMKAAGIIGPFTALKQFADRLRRMAQDAP